MHRVPVISSILLTAFGLSAQEVSIATRAADGAVRYTIDRRSQTTTENRMFRDGEAVAGRGRGGARETTSSSHVVFDERHADGALWRTYREGTAHLELPGRDGDRVERDVRSGLIGTRLYIFADDRGRVVLEGGPEGDELPRPVARRMPEAVSLAGITPDQTLAVGESFTLPAAFFTALAQLDHPVTPAPADAGGPAGGSDSEGGRPPRGGDRQRGRPRGGATAGNWRMAGLGALSRSATLNALTSTELEGEVTGELSAVEDGIAKIAIRGQRRGEGDPAALGLTPARPQGARGGRRGRDRFSGMESSADVTLDLTGELWIDTATQHVVRLVLEGSGNTATVRSGTLRGDSEFRLENEEQGSFRIEVTTAPAPETDDGEAGSDDGSEDGDDGV